MNDVAIDARGITKSYASIDALVDVSVTVERGETVALLGPNGAGKTTLVETLLGARRPDHGTVRVLGQSAPEAAASGRLGAMFQAASLPALATVREAVSLFRRLYPDPLELDAIVEHADLAAMMGSRLERLSGGQAQRVRFALAIAGDPDVVFLDEPTVGMDVESRRRFWTTLHGWSKAGKTVLFATHYLDEVDTAADRVVLLRLGRVAADASPAALRALAAVSTVRFRAETPSPDRLHDLGGVTEVNLNGQEVTLHTADADATVADLYRRGINPTALEVIRGRLEDTFIELTREKDVTSA